MQQTSPGLDIGQQHSNWIRLRTMILLRWVAITGQLITLTVAQQAYDLNLELGLCYLVIGISVIGNLVAMFIYPENKRLTEQENFLMVLFDLLQMSALLYLTGGLQNPFAVLILAPVTVAATVLSMRSTGLISATAIVIVSLLAEFHLPLETNSGVALKMPDIFVFGMWLALITATLFITTFSRLVMSEMLSMSDGLAATQMALAREQKLTDLGGVVAAAAHELGTPLATIKLTSAELREELADRPELREDAELISLQADRCRDILRDMGRAGKDDLHMRQAPLFAVIQEAAEPHLDRGKSLIFEVAKDSDPAFGEPSILRKPEIIHGLRNLIQNAIDFTRDTVWVETRWDAGTISVRILDNGPGFPAHLIGRMGDPFVRRSRRLRFQRSARPGYQGMGLGLFIAKTLLERTGARISFANGRDPYDPKPPAHGRSGAIVELVWSRRDIDANHPENAIAPGVNKPIEA
ncbi:MAG: sensor histidine kinase RegB [Marinibacterium sp.]